MRRPDDLQFLLTTSEQFARSLAVADVLSTVCGRLLGVVPASRVGVLLREPDGKLRLAAGAVRGVSDEEFPRGRELDPRQYPEVARALEHGELVDIPDVATHALVAQARSPLQAAGVRSLLVVPLLVQGRALGVLSVGQGRGDRRFTERQRHLIQAVANQAAVALSNARLVAELQASARELELKIEDRTRSLRESHLRLSVLNGITAAVNMSLDMQPILEAALSGLERLPRVDVAQAWLVAGEPPRELEAWQVGPSGRLSVTRRPLPPGSDDTWLRDPEGQPARVEGAPLEARAHLHAPIVSKDGVVGALHVFSASPEPHGDADIELLQQAAGEISIALERSRLYLREMRRGRQFEAISDIGRQITGVVTVPDMLDTAARLIHASFGYPLACILLPDEGARELAVVGAAGVNPRLIERARRHRQPMSLGLCGQAFLEKRTVNVGDVAADARYAGTDGFPTRSELAVPIVAGDVAVGVIDLQSDHEAAFTDEDVAVLETLADQLAAALRLARLIDELKRESAFTEQVINNLTAGLVVTDSKRVVQVVNHRATEILRTSREEMVGQDLVELLPTMAPLFVYSYEAIGRECEVELRDGTRVPVGFSNSFFADTVRDRNAVIITFRDLSDVRELQRKVRHAERLATIGSVAAGVAHEIRNPLFGISATAQILVRELPKGKLETLCRGMLDETRRLNELVTSLVAFGRPQALKLVELDAQDLVRKAMASAQARAKEAKTRLVLREDAEGGPLVGDADQLTQVLLNLLINAVEANPGGVVEVGIGRERSRGWVVLRVRDHGPGLPEAGIDKIFDLFFTTKPSGSGLGLAISARIIEDHGGTIAAFNADGGGAVFEVRLPMRRDTDSQAGPPRGGVQSKAGTAADPSRPTSRRQGAS